LGPRADGGSDSATGVGDLHEGRGSGGDGDERRDEPVPQEANRHGLRGQRPLQSRCVGGRKKRAGRSSRTAGMGLSAMVSFFWQCFDFDFYFIWGFLQHPPPRHSGKLTSFGTLSHGEAAKSICVSSICIRRMETKKDFVQCMPIVR